jgi:hypothetical protein
VTHESSRNALSRAGWLPRVSTVSVRLSLLLRRCRMLLGRRLGGSALLGLLLRCGLGGGALLRLLLGRGSGCCALLGLLLGRGLGGVALCATDKETPYGVLFTGRAWSEPTLLRLAYHFEQ